MADIVLGLGSSHSPQLSTPSEMWLAYGEGDRRHQELWAADGKPYSYDELMSGVDRAVIEKELADDRMATRYTACQQGIATLGATLEEKAPDIVVMIGDDQLEMFNEGNMPAMLVYWGDTIRNVPVSIPEAAPAFRKANAWGWFADREIDYPIAADLGRHVIEYLVDQRFDVAHSRRTPQGQGMGHAFGYLVPAHPETEAHSRPAHHGEHLLPAQPGYAPALLRTGSGRPRRRSGMGQRRPGRNHRLRWLEPLRH